MMPCRRRTPTPPAARRHPPAALPPRRAPLLLLLLALLSTSAAPALRASPAPGEPRPLSAAERQAVQMALDYLQRGPDAWLEHLDPEGPLGSLPTDEARAEIGVRAGPPDGALWQLQTPGPGQPDGRAIFTVELPSGAGETLVLDLVRQRVADGRVGWRLHRLRSLVDPWDEERHLFVDDAQPAGDAAGSAAAGLSLLLALLAGALALRGRRPVAVGACLIAALVGSLLACAGGEGGAADSPAARSAAGARLGTLEPLRHAVALGAGRQRLDTLARELLAGASDPDGRLATVVDLWRAELALDQTDASEAEEILGRLPADAPVPLGELLRARLAYVQGDPAAVAQAYEHALAAGPDHDGIRLEAASALATRGFSSEAEVAFDLLARMGSRLADVYYAEAMYAVLLQDDARGEAHLRRAWDLQPAERAELLSNPLLARLLARPSIFPVFELSSADEPTPDPPAGRQPVALPAGAEAWLSGRLLHVEMGDGAGLDVPAGGPLAPDATTLLPPDELRRRREDAVLARLPTLRAAGADPAALARPRRRTELLRASNALARRNRWRELAELTAALDGADLGPVPGELVRLRATALAHLERNDEARRLLIRLAGSDLANQRRDPGNLVQLAELVAAEEEYDLAVRLLRKASALSPLRGEDLRIRQLTMQKRLAAEHSVWETERFRVVYPRVSGQRYARLLGTVLEEEVQRLQRWIPLPAGGPPIEVQLYKLQEFLNAYSGTALVLGIYDGVVRVPFADLRSLHPELVSILSHELAHAMIGRVTDEQAPKWLHEGLAEHVQMSQDWVNPYPDLQATSRVIAFPVLEPILRGFAEPQLIELAYGQSAWAVHYIEAVHGVGALHRLLAAYRQGATTPQALWQVFGMSEAEFDRDLRRWAVRAAPAAWPTKVRRYDRELDVPFERTGERRRREGTPQLYLLGTPEPDGPTAPRETREQMSAWHRVYTHRVAAFKRLLGGVMNDLRAGEVEKRHQVCRLLEAEAQHLLDDDEALESPQPAAGEHLRRAMHHFRSMARACAAGDGETTRRYFLAAERSLSRTAAVLEPYGLQP